MAKFGVLAVVMVAFLALSSEASIQRTVITTTVEEADQGSQRYCMKQIQQQTQQLQHCQKYLSQMIGLQHLMQCCTALQSISEPWCRCQAVDRVLRQLQEEGSRQQMGSMMQKAKNLPQSCFLGHQC